MQPQKCCTNNIRIQCTLWAYRSWQKIKNVCWLFFLFSPRQQAILPLFLCIAPFFFFDHMMTGLDCQLLIRCFSLQKQSYTLSRSTSSTSYILLPTFQPSEASPVPSHCTVPQVHLDLSCVFSLQKLPLQAHNVSLFFFFDYHDDRVRLPYFE